MTSADPAPRRNTTLKVILILDSIATVFLAPLALFWGMMSVMASTTTDDAAFANLYAWVNLTLPLAMVVCLIGGWIAWARRRDGLAWILIFLPLAWLIVSVAMMAAWPAN